MCIHSFHPSDKQGYDLCSICGTYYSHSHGEPFELYGNDYWSHDSGHSTIQEQVHDVTQPIGSGSEGKNDKVMQFVPPRGSVVLEIACAPGDLLRRLGERFDTVYGIEVDPRYERELRDVCGPKATLLFGFFPGVTKHLPEATLDCLIGLDVFEHVPDGEAFISECLRLLKPGGTLILMSPFLYSDKVFDEKEFKPSEHIWIYSESWLEESFSEHFSELCLDRWLPGHEVFACKKRGSSVTRLYQYKDKNGETGAPQGKPADSSRTAEYAAPLWSMQNLGPESRKAHNRRVQEGFFTRYFGRVTLDIGYRGYEDLEVVPVLTDAIGIDLNYPGYNGRRLPFEEGSVDTVYASHTLEHIPDPLEAIREWFRVLKVGGHLVLAVPHQYLYEKRTALPSRWNGDHKRFYTPGKLLWEVETALTPNSYRLRKLMDDDDSFDYSIPPTRHSGGSYQIELVVEKIKQPAWDLEAPQPPPEHAPGGNLGPSIDELDAQLEAVFRNLKDALIATSSSHQISAHRLTSILDQIDLAVLELNSANPSTGREIIHPGHTVTDYVRSDTTALDNITSTSTFFHNRKQFKALLNYLKKNVVSRVLMIGTSSGCDAYSFAIEAELAGCLIDITALDIDTTNIETAVKGAYTRSNVTNLDGTTLLTDDVAKFFHLDDSCVQVNQALLSSPPCFQIGDLFQQHGLYDAIICNNVIVHFSDHYSRLALEKLTSILSKKGILAVGGVPPDMLVDFVQRINTLTPVEDSMGAIWDDWTGGRQASDADPTGYIAMPPVDRSLDDWRIRFCTLFQKTAFGFDSPPTHREDLATWLKGVGASLLEVRQDQQRLSGDADTIIGFIDDLLK